MMKASSKRIYSMLAAASLLLSALIVYALLIKPEYDNAIVLKGTLVAKTNAFKQNKAIIDQVKQLLLQYQGNSALQANVSMALPTTENVSGIFQQIQSLARASGLAIQSFGVNTLALQPSSSAVSIAKPLGTLQLLIRLVGPYAPFKDFVRGVETNIRVMDMTTERMALAGLEGQNVYVYDLVINTYYQGSK